jgi:D-alanine-D-alanine ligase
MKKLRIMALMHADLIPPDHASEEDLIGAEWKTEYDVMSTLRGMGHEVEALGVRDDLRVIGKSIEERKPHIAFNLLEEFDGVAVYDHNVVSYLELMRMPYTGCSPRGLMLAHDKCLAKKILSYHQIPTPEFVEFPIGRAVERPKQMTFPLIVKSVWEEASLGISQASIVEDDDRLRERVAFIHNKIGTGALVERYIEGRELYVGVLGNRHLQVLPVWELSMNRMPDGAWPIATERVKWSRKYQDKYGITSGEAKDLPKGKAEKIQYLAKCVYQALGLRGYARIDFRLDPAGEIYVLEANPNPQIADGEDFAESAEQADLPYGALLQRILSIGLNGQANRPG